MKLKSVVMFFWAFLISGCVLSFAQHSTYFFTKEVDGVNHIVQSDSSSLPGWGMGREGYVPTRVAFALQSVLNGSGSDISFDSDIDLGQINASGKCLANHDPIVLDVQNGRKIYGNGHTIKNMCAKKTVSGQSINGQIVRDTLGFFKSLDGVTVTDLKFENVVFSIEDDGAHTSAMENASFYAPVGVLAGSIRNSSIDGITLSSVKLTSPLSGGVAGYAYNSTVKNFSSTDPIVLRNQSVINHGGCKHAGCGGNPLGGGHYSAFLGGVAGLAFDLYVSDVDISVSAQNDAMDTTVAIGGLVGQLSFMASGETKNVVVENVKVGNNSELANGMVMSGLIGEVGCLNNVRGCAKLTISNSEFSGSIRSARGDTAYVAGFVGKNLLDKGFALKIIGSQSNVDISDSMMNSGLRYYYAGGFLGWSSSDNSNSVRDYPDDFVTFAHSKASGKISLANFSATQKNKMFVGGFAGYTPLAHNDSALFADTSNVDIGIDLVNLQSDSVGVGGFVGYLRNKSATNESALINIEKSVYSGSISVNNSGAKTFVGGVAGVYWGMDNPHALKMKNVFVSGTDLLNVSTDGAKVGGICGTANSVAILDRVAVNGNITAHSGKDSLYVGGMMGYISSNALAFSWTNSYYLGTISATSSSAVPPLAGYLAGEFSSRSGNGLEHKIFSNYHSGSDNVDAFGKFNIDQQNATDWALPDTRCDNNRPCWSIHNNVRNADVENLNSFSNGTLSNESIQSAYLADFLNENNEETPWLQKQSENSKFPFFDEGFAKEVPPPKLESSSSVALVPSGSPVSSSSIAPSSSSMSSSSAVSSSSRPWKWTMVSLSQFKKVSLKRGEILYWWDESNSVGEYLQYQAYDPNNAGDGTRGYWIWSNKELSAKAESKKCESFVWNVDSLYTGWNLVANPCGWSIGVGALGDDIQVWHWVDSLGNYDTTSVLGPYEGAWVHTGVHKQISVDATPFTPKTVAKKVVAEDPSNWSVRAILKDEYGKSDSRNIFGVGSAAERWAKPPSGMENDRVSLSIVEGNKRFAKSLKRATDNLEWTLQVKASSDRDGFIKLEGLDGVAANGKKLYMIDGGKVTEMKPGKSVRVALKKSAKNITIVASETAPVVASRMVYDMHVNLSHSVNVDFKVVKAAVEKLVRISLVNALGREVYSTKISAREGVNQLNLGLPQKGLYILTVKIGDDVAAKKIAVR